MVAQASKLTFFDWIWEKVDWSTDATISSLTLNGGKLTTGSSLKCSKMVYGEARVDRRGTGVVRQTFCSNGEDFSSFRPFVWDPQRFVGPDAVTLHKRWHKVCVHDSKTLSHDDRLGQTVKDETSKYAQLWAMIVCVRSWFLLRSIIFITFIIRSSLYLLLSDTKPTKMTFQKAQIHAPNPTVPSHSCV